MTKKLKQLFSFLALLSFVMLAFHPLFHDELEILDEDEAHSECHLCAQLEETVETENLLSVQTSWYQITDKRRFLSPSKNNLQTFRARSPPL